MAARDHDPAADWDEWDEEPDARPRRGLFSRLFSGLKLALLLTPLAVFAYGYFIADCRTRPADGIAQIVHAGVCARNEILGNAGSLQDNLRLIRQIIE